MKDRLAMWRNRLSAHRIVRLGDADMTVAVVPSLGGRLLELHAAGRQWLVPADPAGGGDYPCPEGYSEVAGYVSGSVEPYSCRRQGGWLHLEGTAGNGLKLARRLRVRDGVLRIESRMWNPAELVADCSWGGGFKLLADGFVAGQVALAGAMESVPAARLPADGTLAFEGERLPAGWELDFGDAVVKHRFGGHALYRAALKRGNGLSLYLCSNLLHLEPGAEIRCWQEIEIDAKKSG